MSVVIIGGLLIARHHANIKRLLSGTENKLGAKKGDSIKKFVKIINIKRKFLPR